MVRRRDWGAFDPSTASSSSMFEKLGAVIGTTNLHITRGMRGESLADFQKTRNAQVLYSVVGQGRREDGGEARRWVDLRRIGGLPWS